MHKNIVGRMIKTIYWNLPFKLFIVFYKFRNIKSINRNINFSYHNNLIRVTDKNSIQAEIFLAKRQRLDFYWRGIDAMLEQISREYMLEKLPFLAGGKGFIVDVGANIGEFSLAVKNTYNRVNLIVIEPSVPEYTAAIQNIKYSNWIFCTGLWYEDTQIPFYHANQTGDSSLLPISTSLPHDSILVRSLDSLLSDMKVFEIDLLKLEAEGAEPEILLGAKNSLKTTKYFTADLGPESGVDQLRVYEQCYEILSKSGFEEICRFNGGRETFLFKNTRYFQE